MFVCMGVGDYMCMFMRNVCIYMVMNMSVHMCMCTWAYQHMYMYVCLCASMSVICVGVGHMHVYMDVCACPLYGIVLPKSVGMCNPSFLKIVGFCSSVRSPGICSGPLRRLHHSSPF